MEFEILKVSQEAHLMESKPQQLLSTPVILHFNFFIVTHTHSLLRFQWLERIKKNFN